MFGSKLTELIEAAIDLVTETLNLAQAAPLEFLAASFNLSLGMLGVMLDKHGRLKNYLFLFLDNLKVI